MQFAHLRDLAGLARLQDYARIDWHRFLKGVAVSAPIFGTGKTGQRSRFKIKAVSLEGASNMKMRDDNDKQITIQQCFKSQGVNLQHPNLPCVQLTTRAWYPLELYPLPCARFQAHCAQIGARSKSATRRTGPSSSGFLYAYPLRSESFFRGVVLLRSRRCLSLRPRGPTRSRL
jgi:hypothetical protein